jgi:hypothetical protein
MCAYGTEFAGKLRKFRRKYKLNNEKDTINISSLEKLNTALTKQRKEIEEEREKNLKQNFKEITESSSLSTPLSSSRSSSSLNYSLIPSSPISSVAGQYPTTPSRQNTLMIKKGWKKKKENLEIDDEFALFHPGEDVDEIVQGKEDLSKSPSVRKNPAIWDENYEEEEEIIEQNYKGKEEGEEGEDVRMKRSVRSRKKKEEKMKDFDVNFLEDDDEVDWDGAIGLNRRNIFKKNASYEDQLIKEISTSLRKRSANTPLWIIEQQFPNCKSKITNFDKFFTIYKFKNKKCIKLKEKYNNVNLQEKLTELLRSQRTNKYKPANSISIITVQRTLNVSYKQLRNEITNFDKLYRTTGTGSKRHIYLRF